MDYEVIMKTGNKVSIQGKLSAFSKLPKDVWAGSDAMLLDEDGKAHIFVFFAFLNEWLEVK